MVMVMMVLMMSRMTWRFERIGAMKPLKAFDGYGNAGDDRFRLTGIR